MSKIETMARGKRSTREKLLDAGLDLLSASGHTMISIDEFVQSAGVAKGSFYNHFRDREAFELTIFRRARSRMVHYIRTAHGNITDPAIRLAQSMCSAVGFAIDHPKEARIVLRWIYTQHALPQNATEYIFTEVRAGVISGRFALPSTESGALLVFGMGRAMLLQTLTIGSKGPILTLGQEMTLLMLRALGLATEEAMAISSRVAEEFLRSYVTTDIGDPA